MRNEELVHQTEKGGFVIRLYLTPEDTRPDWDMSAEELNEVCEKIDNGILLWFCAHVVAIKCGHELGHAYLGGCCYSSVKDFTDAGGYFDDMVDEAIADAVKTLKMLNS